LIMVRHTHQDCLRQLGVVGKNRTIAPRPIAVGKLFKVGPIDRPKELFDLQGHYDRKVSLSRLDRSIDDLSDWQSLVSLVKDVDKLLIEDDRLLAENPILKEYDRYTKQRYLTAFEDAGIEVELVKPVESDGDKQPQW